MTFNTKYYSGIGETEHVAEVAGKAPLLYGTGGCWMAMSPGVRKPKSQQYSKNCFWYKINAKKVEGAGALEAGPATLQASDHGNTLGSTVEVGRGAAAP